MPNENRALATIDSVLNIKPIPKADRIEVAQVRGWNCVVKKGDFKPGDLCVYFEIDSVLPDDERYAFLSDSWSKRVEGYRLKTRRLRGQISQGLILPVDRFPELGDVTENRIGEDVTEALNIRIYDPPVSASGGTPAKGSFPTQLVPKTDAERVQNVNVMRLNQTLKDVYGYDAMEYMASAKRLDALQLLEGGRGGPYSADPQVPGMLYIATEKMDGSSLTVISQEGEGLRFCSRNQELDVEKLVEPENKSSFGLAAKTVDWVSAIEAIRDADIPGAPKNFAIQGEVIGPGVQKNPYKLDQVDVAVFSIFDIDNQLYIAYDTMLQMCEVAGLTHVALAKVMLTPMITNTLLKDRSLFQAPFAEDDVPDNLEGFVWRPFWQVPRDAMPLLQFKVINDEYLLKRGS